MVICLFRFVSAHILPGSLQLLSRQLDLYACYPTVNWGFPITVFLGTAFACLLIWNPCFLHPMLSMPSVFFLVFCFGFCFGFVRRERIFWGSYFVWEIIFSFLLFVPLFWWGASSQYLSEKESVEDQVSETLHIWMQVYPILQLTGQ